jgi:uncharacterized protein YbaP (TraB family)
MRLVLLLWLVLLPLGASATEPGEFSRGRLWRIETPAGAVSHLFGTMHSSHPALTQGLPRSVLDAFAASRTLALEVNLLRADIGPFVRAMTLPADTSLTEVVGPELAGEIKRALGQLGLPARAVERMTPWAVSLSLTTSREESVRRKVGMKPLDLYLQLGAERAGLRVVALESLEEQLSVFTDMPMELQAAMLEASLSSRGLMALAMEDLLALYLDGDLDGLYANYVESTLGTDPGFFGYFNDAILVRRNRTMLERALPLLEEGGAFIAVGALHLAGPDSLLAMLRQAGYAVSRAD